MQTPQILPTPAVHKAGSSRTQQVLRKLAWTGVWLVTLAFSVRQCFNLYASHRYQQAREAARAAGFPLSWEEIAPKPVPEEENFAAIPAFRPLWNYSVQYHPFGEQIVYADLKGIRGLQKLEPLEPLPSPRHAHPLEGPPLESLKAAALQKKRIPQELSTLAAAEAVLKAYEPYDPLWKELHEGKKRPHSQMKEASKERPLEPKIHADGIALELVTISAQRALALLKLDRTEEALEECLLCIRLHELIVSGAVHGYRAGIHQLDLALPSIWNGLSAHQWSEPQLQALDSALSKVKPLQELLEALRVEVIRIHSWSRAPFAEFMFQPRAGVVSLLERFFSTGLVRLYASSALRMETELGSRIVVEPPHFIQGPVPQLPAKTGWLGRYEVSKSLMEFYRIRNARIQTYVDLARVALALERFRLKHGILPQTLSGLVPEFLTTVPLDVIGGVPLHYSPRPDGSGFILYSIGANGVDDGGVMNHSPEKDGDWVWPMPN